MNFQNELANYMNLLNISPKELSQISKLSPTIISRYLNGKRTPRIQSDYFNKIVNSLYEIAKSKNINLGENTIAETLKKSISSSNINFDVFVNNFNTLLIELKINIADIAKYTGYDTSFISRIKNKTRKPSDFDNFVDNICDFIVNTYQDNNSKQKVSNILNCDINNFDNINHYKKTVNKWLITELKNYNESVRNFLTLLDNFDLNDYVINTNYNKIKVPTSPVILKTSKVYYGKDGRKQSEADFLKTTLISKSKEPIYFYSNLPMEEASKDQDFKKKWVLAMTMLLKKGLHLNMIHSVDRPINEMLLGLENWIPVYMTGSISPYYFTNPPSNMFFGSYCSSGSVALSGESCSDSLEISRFYLTTKKDEVEYYNNKAKYMLSKAKPLMKIFKEDDQEKFDEFMKSEKSNDIKHIKKDCFKNINFHINKNKWIMISKKLSPKIHFIIYNKKLMNAIETFLNE